jgi:hypothetical protein
LPNTEKQKQNARSQDITTLLEEGIIEVEAKGIDITKVKLRIRRILEFDLNVIIPAGTYFESESANIQNMISIRTETIKLNNDTWQEKEILAGCANRERIVPGPNHTFNIKISPNQYELYLLSRILDEYKYSNSITQAAIWILSDDSSYEDLGILGRYIGLRNYRLISYDDTAQAMQIIEDAGIDITNKRIWRDRKEILENLDNDEIKNWLLNRENTGPPVVDEVIQFGAGKIISYNEGFLICHFRRLVTN